MMSAKSALVLLALVPLLAGCGAFNKLTGKTDNSVLPGTRENILTADQQVNPKVGKEAAASPDAPCDPAVDVECPATAVDQEAPGDSQ